MSKEVAVKKQSSHKTGNSLVPIANGVEKPLSIRFKESLRSNARTCDFDFVDRNICIGEVRALYGKRHPSSYGVPLTFLPKETYTIERAHMISSINDNEDLSVKTSAEKMVEKVKISTFGAVALIPIAVAFATIIFTLSILVGIATATVLGAAFFFWLKFPLMAESPKYESPVFPSRNSDKLLQILQASDEPHRISNRVRQKYVSLPKEHFDRDDFLDWTMVFCNILTYDPLFDPALIPLLFDNAVVIQNAVKSQYDEELRKEAEAAKLEEENDNNISAQNKEILMSGIESDDSLTVKLAMENLKVRKSLDELS